MKNRTDGRVLCLSLILGLLVIVSGTSAFAESKKSSGKSKTATGAPKGSAGKPTYQSAETAGKAPACFGIAPTITIVSPDEGKAGDKVTLTGTNFGVAECVRTVSFGPGRTATFKLENANTITTTVPSGGRKGMAILTVTTASGEDSKPFLVK
ncbi:MAG: IPT/TIG domain-containing protein [Nitrospira sp.]|jgi:hypothetical protein|nr:IPT/TIG domain-containing protein [Nitrospira sp.]